MVAVSLVWMESRHSTIRGSKARFLPQCWMVKSQSRPRIRGPAISLASPTGPSKGRARSIGVFLGLSRFLDLETGWADRAHLFVAGSERGQRSTSMSDASVQPWNMGIEVPALSRERRTGLAGDLAGLDNARVGEKNGLDAAVAGPARRAGQAAAQVARQLRGANGAADGVFERPGAEALAVPTAERLTDT